MISNPQDAVLKKKVIDPSNKHSPTELIPTVEQSKHGKGTVDSMPEIVEVYHVPNAKN